MNDGATAALFYAGVVALVAGTIRALRAAVERNVRDPIGVWLAAGGAAGLVAAVVAFLTGPKGTLPF